jgi:hypothetical protein
VRSSAFELHVSELVLKEARGGDHTPSLERLALIESLPIPPTSDYAIELAERLVEAGSFPPKAAADALHIAIAAAIDFLLTWNFKHLANAIRRHKLESVIEPSGFACPTICTPEELLED